jgi:hypothetical protein
MKEHYFVVTGYIDPSGTIRLGDNPEIAESVLDGSVYDDATGWHLVNEETQADDDAILAELRARLADKGDN